MARPDPHSHTDLAQPHQEHLALEAEVDFAGRTLRATRPCASIAAARPVDLDARGLVDRVGDGSPDGRALRFELGAVRAHPRRAAPDRAARRGGHLRHPLPDLARGLGAAVARARRRRPAGRRPSSSASARRSTRARWCRSRTRRGCASPTTRRSPFPPALRALMAAGAVDREVPRGPGGRALPDGRADPALPVRLRGGRPRGARARAAEPGVGRAVGRRPRRARVRGRRRDAHLGGGALRPLRLGALRPPGAPAVVPLRRDGEPAAHVPHARRCSPATGRW